MLPVCPKCHVALFVLSLNEVEIDFCQQCRGVWLDAGELENLIGRADTKSVDPLAQFQKLNGFIPRGPKSLCPRCDRPLEEISSQRGDQKALTLDRCPQGHGLWFDAHELEELLAAFPKERNISKTIDYLNQIFNVKV